ncbi:MAG: 50S ribosomal protein L6 [Verrucomicrobia bacterium]|nr:50S ribosomal protein L6 [Verrucomicrobiota bacterium]MBU6446029.1 50S ribosomal protein L6 [Verrucomicrobiota bacterium]MDE3046763.1 50S ribosomal protein L6 [Verrucomicrobiota bacterium]
MSRLGKTPIPLPKGVEVKVGADGAVMVKGPKGQLDLKLPTGLSLQVEGEQALLSCDESRLPNKAFYGLYRSLLKNNVVGVHEGYEIRLTLIGVGYRANVQGHKLDLQLGFSHPTWVPIPKGVVVEVDKGTTIILKSADKRLVGQFAAQVRGMKPPEPYKGKGIRYENEYVRKKEGKAAKGKTA